MTCAALRMYASAPLLHRDLYKDILLPLGGGEDGLSPLAVQEGKTIFFDLIAMHRRVDIWGPDAGNWNPDRWMENENLERDMTAQFKFMPFGHGQRLCLGRKSLTWMPEIVGS